MSLIETNWNPTNRQLRQFGVMCLFAFPLVAWMWFSDNAELIRISVAAGMAAAVSGLAYPRILKPLFVTLMVVATPIGMVVGELAMMLIYYTVFLPIGVFFRITNRDRLERSLDAESESYWQPKQKPKSAASYYRQS